MAVHPLGCSVCFWPRRRPWVPGASSIMRLRGTKSFNAGGAPGRSGWERIEGISGSRAGAMRDSLCDFYNVMSYAGTHEQEPSLVHRYRLRVGAGEFGRRQSRICQACRQLLLPQGTSRS
jgi:hypothetical protein